MRIHGFATIVVAAAVLAIHGIPRVGNDNIFCFLCPGIDEDPIGIDIRYLTHAKISLPLYSKGG